MAEQVESAHYFQTGDIVVQMAGRSGIVLESQTLYALVEWNDGSRTEIEQFDPAILVVQRKG